MLFGKLRDETTASAGARQSSTAATSTGIDQARYALEKAERAHTRRSQAMAVASSTCASNKLERLAGPSQQS